jgi:hypothetical protein
MLQRAYTVNRQRLLLVLRLSLLRAVTKTSNEDDIKTSDVVNETEGKFTCQSA